MGHDRATEPYATSHRLTRQRIEIARVAKTMPGAFTVEQLVSAVRSAGGHAGATATVYRAVGAMEDAGFLERVGKRGGSVLFSCCDADGHHHHIVCDRCGRTATAGCPLPDRPAAPDGFTITRHEVTLYGVCDRCAVKETC